MNETKEKARFVNEVSALAKASRQHIERLWRIGIDVSRFCASMSSLFSPIFSTLINAVMRVVGFAQGIRELSLTRLMFLPPFDLWSKRVTPSVDEYFSTEMGRTNVSFLFNVTVARKTAAELARRVKAKTPKTGFLLGPALPSEAERIEETPKGRVEEPGKTVPHIVADLQSRFDSKLTPSIKGIASALQEYGRQTILLAPLLEMPIPSLVGPSSFEGPPSLSLGVSPEKKAPQFELPERPEAIIPQVPSPPRKVAKLEPPRLAPIPVAGLSPEALVAFRYAVGLPSLVLEQEVPMLEPTAVYPLVSPPKSPLPSLPERPLYKSVVGLSPEALVAFRYAVGLPSLVLEQEVPMLEPTAVYPLVSPPKSPLPSIETSYRYTEPTTLPPMRLGKISRLLEEVSPSLTSWIYGVSEILRGTALSLSAVPVAASTAQRVVTEALVQPVSGLEAPMTLGTQEPFSLGLAPSRPETGVGRFEVEAFRIPSIVASLFVALSQRYPLLFSESAISERWETPYELARVAPEETVAPGGLLGTRRLSKLPTVIALAAAENLIAQRLQHEFNALIRELQFARSSYGERLGELGAFGPIRTTMLGKLAAVTPALSPTLEPYAPGVPSTVPPPARSRPIIPTVQNSFNITISAESAEEDLRDLERKISRILSEQIRRYYGSPRI